MNGKPAWDVMVACRDNIQIMFNLFNSESATFLRPYSQDSIKLRGEVCFPNLQFEKTVIDFGCILNNTEATRYINITNNSPMEVSYRWSFVLGHQPVAIFRKPPHQFAINDLSLRPEGVELGEEQQCEIQDGLSDDEAKTDPEVLDIAIEQPGDSPRIVESRLSEAEEVTVCENLCIQ
jgi:hypothetical protein